MAKLNMVKALNLALLEEMERDPDVLVIGEDVGVDGGVFRVTEDLHRRFGSNRVIDSPPDGIGKGDQVRIAPGSTGGLLAAASSPAPAGAKADESK